MVSVVFNSCIKYAPHGEYVSARLFPSTKNVVFYSHDRKIAGMFPYTDQNPNTPEKPTEKLVARLVMIRVNQGFYSSAPEHLVNRLPPLPDTEDEKLLITKYEDL
jgi:hypothetical protein